MLFWIFGINSIYKRLHKGTPGYIKEHQDRKKNTRFHKDLQNK